MDAAPDRATCNIAAALPRLAAQSPQRVAMRCPGTRRADGLASYDVELTYGELDRRSDAIAAGLAKRGIVRGTRAAIMVRPSPEFFLLMFALFKAGAVPVLIDPGIDKRALRQCLDEAAPEAFIGIPLAHVARVVLGWAKSARIRITTGQRAFLADDTLARVERAGAGVGSQLADTRPDEVAAIVFTSGSTGVPKGVVFRHRHFVAQIEMMGEAFGIVPGGVDLPTFPPFALFDPALGLTSVIPDMDPTRPAQADPVKLLDSINRFGCDQLFGSPALMAVLARHGQPMPTIKRVTSAGAPVPPDTVARLRELLPDDAQFWTPYGATECLPVAVIEGRELQSTRAATEAGAGTCVGRAVARNDVRIIRIDDAPIEQWSDDLIVEAGVVGEITVAGPTATDSYFNRDAMTRLAKIRESADGAERIVHRMGDVGYLDEQGRLWFCGRKTHRVETANGPLYTEQVEPVFNTHPKVRRTALVGTGTKGAQLPLLWVELHKPRIGNSEREQIVEELRAIGAAHAHTAGIERFRFHPGFPVDIRHNAKIGREKLTLQAQATESR
ncbi:AMP-dependent synthetase/ligase in alkane synthesis cluster [Lysobacter capsici AZ78]|uniref:AMP-dependent synthetase/ligase in alkane synthesis cluster n=1 Tax=Lysobacter capsici AZ78 TaxID=1444315 RepID=A0A108U9N3_9GAMM|nr:fatty acid CoA ligase family protein [Lysobacter capsici]KWS05109.1 AMP-dependent synthetase/ligase in alkane synthesis cluster [Lysobacter capsici AZ78]